MNDEGANAEEAKIVLLRGWMRDRRHWEDFPERLHEQLCQQGIMHELLLPDIPGNGVRNREQTPATINGIYRQLQSELGIEAPLILVGLSMGGMIAAEWAYRNPQQVKKMILINTSLRPFGKPWQRLRPAVWPQLPRLLAGSVAAHEAAVMAFSLSPPQRTPARHERWVRWSEAYPVAPGNAWRQLLAAARYRVPSSTPPRCPVLVIAGQQDRLVNPLCSSQLAGNWGAQLRALPGAHDLSVDAPQHLATHIACWLG